MPLHVSSTVCSSSGGKNCIITPCRWPSGAQVESPLSICAPDGHLQSVILPDAV